jgi:hypothetical protein
MERTKFNQENPLTPDILEEIERHEAYLMPDIDKDPVDIEVDLNEEVTGTRLYQASDAVHEVAREEKQPLPYLEECPDGHRNPEELEAHQLDLDRLQALKRASRVHEYFTVIDSTGEYKSTPIIKRSLSAERLANLGAFQIQPAKVKIALCVRGNRDN